MNRGDVEAARGAGGTCRGRAMEIRIAIQTMEPLTGTARTEREGPLPFEGWLELLHVLSTLIRTEVDAAGGEPAPAQDALTEEGGHDGRRDDGDGNDEPIHA